MTWNHGFACDPDFLLQRCCDLSLGAAVRGSLRVCCLHCLLLKSLPTSLAVLASNQQGQYMSLVFNTDGVFIVYGFCILSHSLISNIISCSSPCTCGNGGEWQLLWKARGSGGRGRKTERHTHTYSQFFASGITQRWL